MSDSAESRIIHVTGDNFDEQVLQAPQPVLVDFWAPWCGPCKAIAPLLEEISLEHEQHLRVAKVNVDEHPEPAQKYQVRAIPTLLLIKDGEVAGTKIGAASKSDLLDFVREHIQL